MINPVRMKRVAAFPVTQDAIALSVPGVIADFDLRGCMIDRVTGQEMDATLPSTNGKYVADASGKWRGPFGADMPRINGSSLSIAGGQTNLCECVKFNPQSGDTSPFILGNSPDFDIEDMTASLAGTDFEIFKGNAYHLSTINSGVWGRAVVPGSVAVIGDTTIVLVVLAPQGVQVGFNDGSPVVDIPASNEWQLVKIEGVTSVETWAKVSIVLALGGYECWFILPHLLRQKYFESMILGDNTAAPATFATEAGAADNGISVDLDDIPEVKAALQSEGTMVLKWVPGFDKGDGTANCGLIGARDGYTSLSYMVANGNIAFTDGTNYGTLLSDSYVAGDNITLILRWSGSQMIGAARVNNNAVVIKSPDSFDGAFTLGSKLRFHWSQESAVEYQSLTFYNRALTDEEVANV